MTTLQGYALGTLAPGHALMMAALPTAHHQLLAHGLAVRAIRAAGDAEVGIVNNHTLVVPASDDRADLSRAARSTRSTTGSSPTRCSRGAIPTCRRSASSGCPDLEDGDLDVIGAPIDFYGLNFYNPTRVAAASAGSEFAAAGLPFEPVDYRGVPSPVSAGPSSPRRSPNCSCRCVPTTATRCRPS